MWSLWWVWAVFALVLVILEMVASAYIFLGFAIGAGAMALLMLAGVGVTLAGPMKLAVFAVLSLIAYLALRHFVPGTRGEAKVWTEDINE